MSDAPLDAHSENAGEADQSPRSGDTNASRVGAWGATAAWVTLLIATALALAADLGSKEIAFRLVADQPVVVTRESVLAVSDPRLITNLIPRHHAVVVAPRLLEFTLVLNPGAVFGIGPGQRWFFVGFTGIALGFGVWMFGAWTGPRDQTAHAAVGLLLGGGLGNLYDRLVFGCVRDFIHPLPGVMWPRGGEVWPYVSNVADLVLLIGIGLLLIHLWRRDRATRPRSQT